MDVNHSSIKKRHEKHLRYIPSISFPAANSFIVRSLFTAATEVTLRNIQIQFETSNRVADDMLWILVRTNTQDLTFFTTRNEFSTQVPALQQYVYTGDEPNILATGFTSGNTVCTNVEVLNVEGSFILKKGDILAFKYYRFNLVGAFDYNNFYITWINEYQN